ncbi:YgaP family membrane protein [Prauserella muralis]|uniref:YgaP family membrane protein n=1 Tax=Prauserella muralis TaxID=588067 RepID=UPI000DD4D27F|nr:DUF2892 domain-containing protein [Prauserella muralis]TWE27438.1 DUF2892 family protein [Prauserella muralis]
MTRQSESPPVGRRSAWRTVNITPVERVGRIVVGLGAIVVGVILLAAASSVLAIVLEVLLVLAGADLLVTGALGHCPLYRKLSYVPPSLRRP